MSEPAAMRKALLDASKHNVAHAGLMEEAANLIEEMQNYEDFICDNLDYGKGEYVGLHERWETGDVDEQYLTHQQVSHNNRYIELESND